MTELVAVYAASVALGLYLAVAAKRNHGNGLTYTKRRFQAAAGEMKGKTIPQEKERTKVQPIRMHRAA